MVAIFIEGKVVFLIVFCFFAGGLAQGRSAEEELQLLKQAVQYGMEALRFFDDADDVTEAAVEQDIYNARPLPYIIGTKAFLTSRDAGLGEISEDEGVYVSGEDEEEEEEEGGSQDGDEQSEEQSQSDERQHSMSSSRGSERHPAGADGVSPPKDFRTSLSEQVAAHAKAHQPRDDQDEADTFQDVASTRPVSSEASQEEDDTAQEDDEYVRCCRCFIARYC